MTNRLPMTWARRLTLLAGVPLAVALIGFTGFTFVADIGQGSYPVSYRVPVRAGVVSVNLDGADLRLRQVSGPVARLTGTVHYSLIRPALTEDAATGSNLRLHCQIPFGDCGLGGTLSIPARTAVAVSSGGGDLSVSGFSSGVTLETSGGDMDATGLAGRVTMDSGGGDIGARALTAPLVTVRCGGGDVQLIFSRPPEDLQVDSGGGDISIVLPRGATAYDVQSSTGGGDISNTLPVSSSSVNKITVSSGGGDISLTEGS